ncbi:MAG: hypothetical protein LVQ96_00575 [Thermoplasmatales archaeon]|nr:hypothetical protein [Thermoplasmatales archaeon]
MPLRIKCYEEVPRLMLWTSILDDFSENTKIFIIPKKNSLNELKKPFEESGSMLAA